MREATRRLSPRGEVCIGGGGKEAQTWIRNGLRQAEEGTMSIRTKASALHSSLLGIAAASLVMLAACGGSGSSDGSGSPGASPMPPVPTPTPAPSPTTGTVAILLTDAPTDAF